MVHNIFLLRSLSLDEAVPGADLLSSRASQPASLMHLSRLCITERYITAGTLYEDAPRPFQDGSLASRYIRASSNPSGDVALLRGQDLAAVWRLERRGVSASGVGQREITETGYNF